MATTVFVEQAAASVANEEIYQGESEANALLSSARKHIYHWPRHFQGFQAALHYVEDGTAHEGLFTASESRRIQVQWSEEFDHRWLRFQLEELISHREAPERSKLASKTGCELGDEDPIFGRKVVFLGDKMNSFYRLKDNRIAQIGRSYGNITFVINIDSHFNFGTIAGPLYAAGNYTAFYWNRETGQLTKTETYRDSYATLKGIAIPRERQVCIAQSLPETKLSVRQIRFLQPSLLTSARV